MGNRNRKKNKKVTSMTLVDFSDMKLPMICVYNRPTDFPDKIIARVWEGSINKPTYVYAEYETLEECRLDARAAGFCVLIPRDPKDDICIVESYFR